MFGTLFTPRMPERRPELLVSPMSRFDPEIVKQHTELSRRLGISTGTTEHQGKLERVRAKLKEMGLAPYDYGEVHRYLDSIFGSGKDAPDWFWRPLRSEDGHNSLNSMFNRNGGTWSRNGGTVRSYNNIVPLPVLRTVEELIAANLGLSFYVSDKADANERVNPDPFLLIHADFMPRWVIEQWDEPTFTGRRQTL